MQRTKEQEYLTTILRYIHLQGLNGFVHYSLLLDLFEYHPISYKHTLMKIKYVYFSKKRNIFIIYFLKRKT